MRAYLPLTLESLSQVAADARVPAGMGWILAEDESEEAEYAALMAAADASAHLSGGTGRRVVLAADVPDADAVVPRSAWEAVHVDADADHDPDDDLAWFGVQEIPGLLDLT